MGSLIRATALWGYPELVRELGGDPAAFLARFHIPAGAEHQEDAFISFASLTRMLEASAEELRCPDFGLRLSGRQGLDILGPIAVIARNASDRAGRGGGDRALPLHPFPRAEAGARAARRGRPRVHLRDDRAGGALHSGIRAEHGHRGAHHPPARRTAGRVRMPSRSCMPNRARTPPTATRWAARCASGSRGAGSSCRRRWPTGASRTRTRETRRIATKYLEATYLPASAPLSDRVAELTRRLLPTGQCSAEAIADELAMHPRTLQRRLADEGVRCQDIIDRERRAQAARYLAEPGLHLTQIAGLLGYAEQSALNRSCRRWFGKTPRQYRAEPTATVPT